MDLILWNGKVETMDPGLPQGEAVAVKDGVIRRVGDNAGVLELATQRTRVVDLGGRLLLPGFNGSHMHLLRCGYAREKAALEGADGIGALIALGRSFLEAHPGIPWLQGRGWNNERWADPELPTRWDLDRISSQIPITFMRDCNRMAVVNSRALEAMGVTRGTRQPEGGRFDVDGQGEPLGIFRDSALELVERTLPRVSKADLKRMLSGAARDVLRCGITAVQSDDFEAVTEREYPLLLPAFRELAAAGQLPVRVYEQCRWTTPARLREYLDAGCLAGTDAGRFQTGPLKILADGVLGARSAYLTRPYADAPETCGQPRYTQEALDELVEAAHCAEMPVAIHAIGDKGLDMALDAIERAMLRHPGGNLRHGVIHCQVTRPEQLIRLRKLDLVAHLQPIFVDADQYIVEKRVGPELARTSYSWRTIADLGVHYAFGSDSPIDTFDVMDGIYCAVTRKGRNGCPPGGWMPEQRLTVERAVYGYTLGAAYAAHQENLRGSISVGKLADMAVLERDIFTIPTDEIKDVAVDMTILDGEIVYRR